MKRRRKKGNYIGIFYEKEKGIDFNLSLAICEKTDLSENLFKTDSISPKQFFLMENRGSDPDPNFLCQKTGF